MRTTKFKIINDHTGEWEVEFYDNKRKCRTFEIDLTKSKIAKRYSGFSLINKDLNLLLKLAITLKINVDDFEKNNNDFSGRKFGVIGKGYEEIQDTLFSLFASISIIYGRLFTENKSRGSSLNRKDYVKPQHSEIHDELLKIRHNYIAHSSDKMYEDSKVFVVINPVDESQFRIVYHFSGVNFPAGKLITEMIEHFKSLSGDIKNKLDELNMKLIEEYKNKKLIIKP
jgi:hypothetical protein